MIFLGTGASEGIPNPFCECEVCRNALKSGDPREKRGRSAFSIDEQNLIDFGPDVITAAGRFGVSMAHLRNVFYTHFHSDHFCFGNWENPRMSVTPPPHYRVYLSELALEGLRVFRDLLLSYPSKDHERDIRFYAETMEFITVNLYCEENYEFLKGKTLDFLIMECTFGAQDKDPDTTSHLTCAFIQKMVDRFRREDVVSDRTEIWLTHIGHKGGLNHVELRQKMREMIGPQIDVAYDGLRLADL